MYIPTTTLLQANTIGSELSYAELTTTVNITATVEATPNDVVAAGAVSFDGSTRVEIVFFCARVDVGSTAGSFVLFNLWDGATDLGRVAVVAHSLLTFAPSSQVYASRFLTPTAASHTYKIVAWRVNSDGAAVGAAGGAGTTVPGFIRITRA